MDDEIYITPNIIVKNKTFYYTNNETNRLNKINDRNWHKIMCDDGWFKIDWSWRVRLNENSQKNNKNCTYAIRDCGGEGNCLFECIATALNYTKAIEPNLNIIIDNNLKQEYYTSNDIRNIASSSITIDNFDCIIESYKLAKLNNEFYGNWNPFNIFKIEDLQNEIMKMGDNFWGDHIIINLLEEKLNVSFIILNNEEYIIQNIMNNIRSHKYVILLYYSTNLHFQLIGKINKNTLITIFEIEKLPMEIFNIFNKDCRVDN